MNMFPFILHIVMLERELETQEQKYRSQWNSNKNAEPVQRSSKKRFTWFFDRFQRSKPVNPPVERVHSTPCGCRNARRPVDPVVSPCSSLSTGGSK
jgi:hypothetical protein